MKEEVTIKIATTGVVLIANLLLLNPKEVHYDLLVSSFVFCIWLGFIGIVWGEQLNSLINKLKGIREYRWFK